MKRFVNVDVPRFHANPKGDDYGPKDIKDVNKDVTPWDKQPDEYNATLGGFNLQLTISPGGRDWHLRVAVPEHFQHKDFDVCDHISLSNPSVRDI